MVIRSVFEEGCYAHTVGSRLFREEARGEMVAWAGGDIPEITDGPRAAADKGEEGTQVW